MAETWEAPAKLNLSLLVKPVDSFGFHPIRSLVQAIEWCDLLTIEEAHEDHLSIVGADLPDGGDNLVWKAVSALRRAAGLSRPLLAFRLEKKIAVAAGLGGGSADAAAALRGVGRLLRVRDDAVQKVAAQVGSDVSFFLNGGTAWMGGRGELIETMKMTDDYVVAIAVPPPELGSAAVYRRWDEMGEPRGPELPHRALPPSLRDLGPFRNDLQPAAIDLSPDLADWQRELAAAWERPVAMSGSGPALFGFFPDMGEASDAVRAVVPGARATTAASLRRVGVELLEG